MSNGATTDAFLSGQGIPVGLSDVEAELARLWGPAVEREGGPDLDHPAVTRIVLANLVVARLGEDAPVADEVLDTVLGRYPCRAIILRSSGRPGRSVSAEVSALCRLPESGQTQVCTERITLLAGADAPDLLPGAVRPLLEAGLPLVLWWAGEPRRHEPLFRDLANEATRLLLDLPDPAPEPAALRVGLDLGLNGYARDLAWFGTTRWRELVAQFFDAPGSAPALTGIAEVEIRTESPTAGPLPRAAAWLAAWLAGQLGWKPDRREPTDDGGVAATFHGPSGPVSVRLGVQAEPSLPEARIDSVTLTTRTSSGEGTFRLSRAPGGSDEVRIEACVPCYCDLPRLVRAAELDAARRLAAALASSRDDPPYRHALPILLWLLDGRKTP